MFEGLFCIWGDNWTLSLRPWTDHGNKPTYTRIPPSRTSGPRLRSFMCSFIDSACPSVHPLCAGDSAAPVTHRRTARSPRPVGGGGGPPGRCRRRPPHSHSSYLRLRPFPPHPSLSAASSCPLTLTPSSLPLPNLQCALRVGELGFRVLVPRSHMQGSSRDVCGARIYLTKHDAPRPVRAVTHGRISSPEAEKYSLVYTPRVFLILHQSTDTAASTSWLLQVGL